MSQPHKKPRAAGTGREPGPLGELYRSKKQSPARRRRGPPVPWVIGVLIIAAGIVAWAKFRPRAGNGPQAGPAAPAATRTQQVVRVPRIAFASTSFDFGRADGDQLVDCTFTCTNTGGSKLVLSEVNPSCGCMRLQDAVRELAPGQSGAIKVRLDTKHYTGPFAKSVFVTCNDPASPKVHLEVKGYVFRPIEVKPEFAVINLTAETPSNAAMVRILSHIDEPLTLSPPVCSEQALQVELRTNRPGKDYQLVVSTRPSFPFNALRAAISVPTSFTNMPMLNVIASINQMPLVGAFPNAIRLPAPPYTNAVAYTVYLRNNSTNTLQLSEPAVNAPGVTVELKEEQAGAQFAAHLTFPAGFTARPDGQLELILKSNLPLLPQVKVPIFVSTPAPAPPP